MDNLIDDKNEEGVEVRQIVANIPPSSFIPLIDEIMKRNHIKKCELADITGISRSRLTRLLKGQRAIETSTVYLMFDALKIDLMRALLAVSRLGDWELYFDPDVEVISDLIDVLPTCLSQARSGHKRAKISITGTLVLAKRLSDMIANNDRETERRQMEWLFEVQ
jgi:transcriptional regulator with XRE-family HTH domain